jgi:formylglycine-generating enzyme
MGAPQASACPADMVEVQGEYCPRLAQICVARRKPWQCAEFQAPSVCQGQTQAKHYCIDRYEFPNRAGGLPEVMSSWNSAKAECASIGKRLCTEAEWTLACEGPERLPFPYGFVRDADACSIDKRSPKVNEQRLFSPRTQAAELARLDQREPSGSRERCISAFGVHDMTGNVDELVVNESGIPYKSARKGGNWGEYRNACRPSTRGHDEGFRYYQTGFRCCRGPAASQP